MRKSQQKGIRMDSGGSSGEARGYCMSMRCAYEQAGRVGGHLHGSHVVESVVQLLADGFVLQFLSVQLVYEQEVGGREARA